MLVGAQAVLATTPFCGTVFCPNYIRGGGGAGPPTQDLRNHRDLGSAGSSRPAFMAGRAWSSTSLERPDPKLSKAVLDHVRPRAGETALPVIPETLWLGGPAPPPKPQGSRSFRRLEAGRAGQPPMAGCAWSGVSLEIRTPAPVQLLCPHRGGSGSGRGGGSPGFGGGIILPS
eukprot:gene13234-biopygen21547